MAGLFTLQRSFLGIFLLAACAWPVFVALDCVLCCFVVWNSNHQCAPGFHHVGMVLLKRPSNVMMAIKMPVMGAAKHAWLSARPRS